MPIKRNYKKKKKDEDSVIKCFLKMCKLKNKSCDH